MNLTDRIADLSMLWKQASLVFPYFDQQKIDWDQTYREYLPKVMNAKTDREFHLLLAEFMNLLGDGHTDYLLPKALQEDTGYLPFTLRFVQDTYCIDGIISEHQAYSRAQVVSINGIPFSELIQEVFRYSYHVGNYVPRYGLHKILPFLLKPNGNMAETSKGRFSFDLLPSKPENLMPQMPRLSIPYRQIHVDKLDIRLYDGGILYIRLDDFLYSKAVEEVRSAILRTPGIMGLILDLRENIGGMTLNGGKIAELLIPGQFHGCQKRTRSMTGIGLSSASQIMQWSEEDMEKHIAAGYSTREEIEESKSLIANTHYDIYVDTYGCEKHTPLFSGPCVILTSRHTVSAAEDFIAMFRTNQRATIVGTETCGTTGTPLIQKLSCGGWMRICSVGYRLLDGTEFIGCGIKPDIFCNASVDDFRQGYDFVLDQGMTILKSQTGQA
ncbi:MAG: S41 family peptidase [Faecousia sp.]